MTGPEQSAPGAAERRPAEGAVDEGGAGTRPNDGASGTGRDDGADTRVDEVERLPLAERAAAYRAWHEELAQRLEQAPGDA